MVIYPFRPLSLQLPMLNGGVRRYIQVFRLQLGDMVFAALVRAEPHEGPCREAAGRCDGLWKGRPMEWAEVVEGDFLAVTPITADLLDDSFQDLLDERLKLAERSLR